MIVGIGTDIIEQSRVMKACERDAFLLRVFTKAELQMIQTDKRKAAGCWAVKEAVVKVFGTGFSGVLPTEVEVLRDEAGKPYVKLYEKADKKAREMGISHIHVSISHTGDLVSAVAIGEAEKDRKFTQREDGRNEISG